MKYAEACECLGLGTEVELTDPDLKKAFKRAALKHHPDKNLDNAEKAKEAFQQISTAFDFLTKCVERGQTGPNQPRWGTDHPMFDHDNDSDADEEEYYYDNEDYVDLHDILFAMFFEKMRGAGGRRSGGGMPGGMPAGFGFGMPGASFATYSSTRASSEHHESRFGSGRGHGGFYEGSDEEVDDELDEMLERMAEQNRLRKEQREKEKKKQAEHAQYMVDRARQAELEGRDFFESWNIKQLAGECQRRGISIKNKQQSEIIELLIADEAQKRLREQRKKESPLLDEWAEVIHANRGDMNGLKVRVVDFFDDKYTVEWDANAAKKGKKGYIRDSKKARLKAENLRLWGTGAPLGTSFSKAPSSVSSDKENQKGKKKSKSKVEKKKAPAPTSASPVPAAKVTNAAVENTKSVEKKKPAPPPALQPSSVPSSKPAPSAKVAPSQSSSMPSSTPAPASKATAAAKTEAPETKCCAICRKVHNLVQEGVEEKKKDSSLVILPCAHIFCSDCCGSSNVRVRSCRLCGKCDPGVDALKCLPYIVDLRDPPQALLDSMYKEYSLIKTCESVEAMEKQHEKELDALKMEKAKVIRKQKDEINSKTKGKSGKEKKGKMTKEMFAAVEVEFEPRRKAILERQAMLWRSVDNKGGTKKLAAARDAAIAETTKAINKHYRRASVTVHPDRRGEAYRGDFEALTTANATLSNVELRQIYLEQMLEIVCKVGTHWLLSSHKSFVQKYQPDMAEPHAGPKTSSETGDHQKPLQIEGGLMYAKPRKPGVTVVNSSERTICVLLSIPAGSVYEFNQYCQAIHITGERGDTSGEDAEEFVTTIAKDHLKSKLDGVIECTITLPEEGLWNIYWSFTIEIEPGILKNSEVSTEARVELVSPKLKAKIRVLKSFEAAAKKCTERIHSAIKKLGEKGGGSMSIHDKYSTLQEAILKGHHTVFHLEKALLATGANVASASSSLHQLREALARARSHKSELDKALAEVEKKAALRDFKMNVIHRLENSEGAVWVANVSDESLKGEGGSANRLYQFLMEGKKAYSLELVDASTLFAAANRNDLFTPKQLQAIIQRAEDVEILAAEEAARAEEESKEREAEERQLQDLARRAKLMERGTTVQIQGLKSQPSLNGRLATYMGLGEHDRFVLRLSEGRDIALQKQNFCQWDGRGVVNFGSAPKEDKGWSCEACTFSHEGPNAKSLYACSMCRMPKGAGVPSTDSNNSNKEKCSRKTSTSALQEKAVGKQVVKPPTFATESASVVFPVAKEKSVAPSVTEGYQAVSSGAKAKPAAPSSTEGSQVVSPAEAPSSTEGSRAVSPVAKEEPATASSSEGFQTVSPVDKEKPAPVAHKVMAKLGKLPKKCKFGQHCKALQDGSCKFLHSAEDHAAATGYGSYATPTKEHSTPKASVAVATPESSDSSTSKSTSVAKKVEGTVMINVKAAFLVIGPHGKFIKDIARRTGATIRVLDKKVDANGMCPVSVKGKTQTIVDRGAVMVQKKAAQYVDDVDETSSRLSSSISSNIGIVPGQIYYKGPSQTNPTKSNIRKKGGEPTEDLASFLRGHEKFLKCPSIEFFQWLRNMDIETLPDLAEACVDEDFAEDLVAKGLKKFKLATFRKSAVKAARAAE